MDTKNTLRTAPAHYRELTERIVKLSGMKHALHVYETDASKTWQTHHTNGVPVLAYNPEFIAKNKAAVKWTDVALFASEVVYHKNRDLYGKYICEFYNLHVAANPNRKRLSVDYFVGRVLRHEGATMEEAMEVISFLTRYKSFDEREERRVVVVKGWEAADKKIKAQTPLLPAPKQQDTSATALASVLLGLIIYLFKE